MDKTEKEGPDYQFEAGWPDDAIVIGVDEAGRGPWAGPVVAAAFWIAPDRRADIPKGLTDSKKLSAMARSRIETALMMGPHLFGIGEASSREIDEIGLLPATFAAMDRAFSALAVHLDKPITAILVDGNLVPPFPSCQGAEIQAIIKGDSRSLSIAAASIMAKEARDRQMCILDDAYPVYGFAKHKGYGTKAHQEALCTHGPCPEHRRSFKPIQAILHQA